MNILSRDLKCKVDNSTLKGVRIARGAVPLTDCIYADDLLLFGEATIREAGLIKTAIQQFSSVSGQMVGPGKSSIWFSDKTPQQLCHDISLLFSVGLSNLENRYLGAPIKEGRDAYNFIIDKFSSQLNAWKCRILSPAGRLVLIKSVLQSLPVYFMATAKFPNRVLNALTNLMR
jgi:hypothetical protein